MEMQRIENALWGLFAADALAMPAHWYYSLEHLERDFAGGVSKYQNPPHPHPDSFMVGSDYLPDVDRARELGRPYDILHDNARFYRTNYASTTFERSERETEHGNLVPRLEERHHYHHGLQAGENTLGAHLVRVLMRSCLDKGVYEPEGFLQGFVEHLTTPGRNRDPYTEIYVRRWFENYSRGVDPKRCAALQREVWSIGSMGGVVRPLVTSLLAKCSYQGTGMALGHQNLTHRSENVACALHVLVDLLFDLLTGSHPSDALSRHAARVREPEITGKELQQRYKDADGPGNIPGKAMWRLHTELKPEPFDLDSVAGLPESEVIQKRFATACYPEHGLPLVFYFARRHQDDVEQALLANANAGGDNVHRGMILGMVAGAASDSFPEHLKQGLQAYDQLKEEIAAFTVLAMSGKGL